MDQAAALTHRQATQLLRAYTERKGWETRVQAVAILNALGEAMQAKREPMSLGSLAALGFKIED